MASIAGWCVLPLGALWQFLIMVAINLIIIMMNFIIIIVVIIVSQPCHRRRLSTVPLTLGIQMAASLCLWVIVCCASASASPTAPSAPAAALSAVCQSKLFALR